MKKWDVFENFIRLIPYFIMIVFIIKDWDVMSLLTKSIFFAFLIFGLIIQFIRC